MAIRFVDKTPEDDPGHKAEVPRPNPRSHPSTLAKAPVPPAPPLSHPPAIPAAEDRSNDVEPKLPHPKPEPKARGRKASRPLGANAEIEPVQVPLEGLLPTLPHAKPDPKPRGRKKAFG